MQEFYPDPHSTFLPLEQLNGHPMKTKRSKSLFQKFKFSFPLSSTEEADELLSTAVAYFLQYIVYTINSIAYIYIVPAMESLIQGDEVREKKASFNVDIPSDSSDNNDDTDSPFTVETNAGLNETAKEVDNNSKHVSSDFCRVLSALYGKVVVVMGMAFPLAEAISSHIPHSFYDVFYMYLYFGSIIFMAYVYVFILRKESEKSWRTSSFFSYYRGLSNRKTTECSDIQPAGENKKVNNGESETVNPVTVVRKKYDVEYDAHYGSFYLRLGAVAFGIGTMIYSLLEIGQHFELDSSHDCYTHRSIITPSAFCIFTFAQMYFVFLNSKMLIYKYQKLSRFGLMHMVATNLCVWLNVLVEETKHEIVEFYLKKIEIESVGNADNETDVEVLSRQRRGLSAGGPYSPHQCTRSNMLGNLVQDAAPFLFPCCIEYSLICAAILYVMWKNIGKKAELKRTSLQPYESRHHYSVDCAGANKGLFIGILVLTLTIISLILFFVLISDRESYDLAITESKISELTLYTVAILAVFGGFCRMRSLNYNHRRDIELDNILLVIAQTGLYMYSIFIIIGAYFNLQIHNILMLITGLAMLVQGTLQTLFILDAGRRESHHTWQFRRKPGRECVTLLLLSNLAMWAINSFETSRAIVHPVQLKFYGQWAWTIIIHLSTPLAIFYRFHSTVCLCEIWTRAYKPKSAP